MHVTLQTTRRMIDGCKTRLGFTLVELLVVIAVIGVLVALLLPAVQHARESARSTQCRNNLRQIGLAAQLYHNAHHKFATLGEPQVAIDGGARDASPAQSWMTQMLPFLEETALADLLADAATRPDAGIVQRAAQTPVVTYYCPSRREPVAYPLHDEALARYGAAGARTDYAINGGSSTKLGLFNSDLPGIWDPDQDVSVKDVADGLGATYLVGEKAMSVEDYTTGLDLGDTSPIIDCRRGSCVRYAKRIPAHDQLNKSCYSCHDFGSAHATTWNAVFCDGSVRPLSYSMTFEVHSASATRQGGEIIDSEGAR
jgi:prepilin-type N-terminal cleavage/methylation domain-containing protein